ncbi:MAG: mismatch-specific glycosylase [Roseomonas sp.]|nr:mismatch-specific glycosylase [Roseomonas sp.]
MSEVAPVLPDLLRPGLRLVFCGSAPGAVSAARGAYYAHPGNRFWPILAEGGFTPGRWAPKDYPRLLERGIGLTDLAKYASGNDADLPADAYDVEDLARRIREARPAMLAFTAKAPAAAFLGVRTTALSYGRIEGPKEFPPLWVLPSTSGSGARHWDPRPWLALGEWFRAGLPP